MKITLTVEIADELLRDAIAFAFQHRSNEVVHPDFIEPIGDEGEAVLAFEDLVKAAIAASPDAARHLDVEELAREVAISVIDDHAPEEAGFDGHHEDARDWRAIQHRDISRYYEGE